MARKNSRGHIDTGGGRGSTVVNGRIYRKGDSKKDVERKSRGWLFRRKKAAEVREATSNLVDTASAPKVDSKQDKDREIRERLFRRDLEAFDAAVVRETGVVSEELKRRLGVDGEVVLNAGSLRRVLRNGPLKPFETILNGRVKLEGSDVELLVEVSAREEERFYRFDLEQTPGLWRMSRERVRPEPHFVAPPRKSIRFSWVERKGSWWRRPKIVSVNTPEQLRRIVEQKK